MISVMDRRPDISLARFSEHWRTIHRQHALALVPVGLMLGYVQNHRRDVVIPGLDAPGDGAPELWMDSVDAPIRLGQSPAYREGAALDEPNFMAGSARMFLGRSVDRQGDEGRQQVVGSTKLLLFYAVTSDMSPDQVARIWRDEGLTLSAAPTGVRRAEFYIGLDSQADSHSCAEAIWWASDADFERAWNRRSQTFSPFVDPASLKGMLVEELPVLWPEEAAFQ
jgi:hypothetical protein